MAEEWVQGNQGLTGLSHFSTPIFRQLDTRMPDLAFASSWRVESANAQSSIL